MVWKIGNDSVVFVLEDIFPFAVSGEKICEWIRSKAYDVMREEGIGIYDTLEIKTFLHGRKYMVFVSCIQEQVYNELYRFLSVDDLLDAFQSGNCDESGTLFYYEGTYYAALYEPNELFADYAEPIFNAKNYCTFLREHGKIISQDRLFVQIQERS